MDDVTPRLVGGRYRLVRPLGHGGMSDVHLAHDELLGRDVAVKLVRADRLDGPADVDRLEREARATARLAHPNVVVVHDVVRDRAGAAIVMELVSGGTLADRLRRDGALAWAEAVRVVREVARGLGAAHAAGVVHRDVKPSNVLLGPDDRVRVADFGIASTGTSTETTTLRGSVPYVAPEQARGDAVDGRADVYALGCVLFNALTGRVPFDGGSGAATIGQHLHRPPPRPAGEATGIPPRLDDLVVRMLAKDPSDRPTDMDVVVRELDAVLDGEDATAVLPPASTVPVAASSATTSGTASGSSRRRRRAGSLGVLAVVGLAALGWAALDGGAADPGTTTATSSPSPGQASPAPASTPTTPSPSPTAAPAADPTPRPSATRPETVAEAATAFRQVLVGGRNEGQASAKAVEELDALVSEVVRKAGEDKPKDVRDVSRKLLEKIDEAEAKGEITSPALADALRDAARDFLRLIGGGA